MDWDFSDEELDSLSQDTDEFDFLDSGFMPDQKTLERIDQTHRELAQTFQATAIRIRDETIVACVRQEKDWYRLLILKVVLKLWPELTGHRATTKEAEAATFNLSRNSYRSLEGYLLPYQTIPREFAWEGPEKIDEEKGEQKYNSLIRRTDKELLLILRADRQRKPFLAKPLFSTWPLLIDKIVYDLAYYFHTEVAKETIAAVQPPLPKDSGSLLPIRSRDFGVHTPPPETRPGAGGTPGAGIFFTKRKSRDK